LNGSFGAVPAGGEGAPVEGRGAWRDNRLFLDGPASICYCFSELSGSGSPFHMAGMALAIHAKQKGGQAIENKQLREMVHFAPLMISVAYDRIGETVRFARRKESFRFPCFSRCRGPRRKGAKSTADSGRARRTSRRSATRKWRRKPLGSLQMDSEVAPAGSSRGRENRSGELHMRRFAHNLRRESIFFIFRS
jgi:hypothetical protein